MSVSMEAKSLMPTPPLSQGVKKMIPVFYAPRQLIGSDQVPFGGNKPKHVLNLVSPETPIIISKIGPIRNSDLIRAHDPEYVDRILSGRIKNGFGSNSLDHAISILYTVGNFVQAVDYVTSPDYPHPISPIAYSLTSGFHHAGHSYSWGYCTFNAPMIAAHRFRERDNSKNVLILDGDAHFGDGCVDIIDHKNMGFVDYVSLPGHSNSNYMKDLLMIGSQIREGTYDLILYQPGADSLAADSYRAGTLTREEFQMRDKIVFSSARTSRTPLVFNLAGGYGCPSEKDTVMAHYSTWSTALKEYVDTPEQDLLRSNQVL